jgi:hypothetical protein
VLECTGIVPFPFFLMKKTASLIVGLSLMASALPAFADESSSSTSSVSSSSVSSSISSSSTSSSKSRPCMDKEGEEKGMCLRAEAKKKIEDRRKRTVANTRVAACKGLIGANMAHCLRSQLINKIKDKVDLKVLGSEKKSRRKLEMETKELIKQQRMLLKSNRSSTSSKSSSSPVSSSSVSSSSVSSTSSTATSASSTTSQS